MDKCCVFALRKATGVIAVMGSLVSLLLACDLHASGTSLTPWSEKSDDPNALCIKLIILGALALGYGIASLKHFSSKRGAFIPTVIGIVFMIVCAFDFGKLIAFFSVAVVLTMLSFATYFERERMVIRWENAPAVNILDYDY